MDRRESLKSLLIGGVGVAGLTVGVTSCKIEPSEQLVESTGYGRTPAEKKHDEAIAKSEPFFSATELGTIAVLCDLILPPTPTAGSATEAEVPEFIEFMVKDLPANQLPLQGGLMWLEGEATRRYNNAFASLGNSEQRAILDHIAYPDIEQESPEFEPGRKFFSRLRNLVLTGYYTTKMGIDDLGYVGNRPNLWDGPPAEVLKKHGLTYDEHMKDKYIDHDQREVVAEWDDKGNLLT